MLGKVKGMLGGKPSAERPGSSQRRETKHIKSDKQRGRVWGETTRGQDLKDATDVRKSDKPAADAAMIKKAIEKTNVGSRMSPEHMGDLIDHMEVRAAAATARAARRKRRARPWRTRPWPLLHAITGWRPALLQRPPHRASAALSTRGQADWQARAVGRGALSR